MCEYCENKEPFSNDYMISAVKMRNGNILDTGIEEFKIKYCPWCGRRLKNKNEQMETV